MTVAKITNAPTQKELIDKTNEVIDKYIENKATYSSSISIEGAANTDYSGSINIGQFSSCGSTESTVVGYSAISHGSTSSYASCFGDGSSTFGQYSTALGSYAKIGISTSNRADCAIQIGYGTNTFAKTLSIGFYDPIAPTNWQLLDGVTGLIPTARLSTFTGADGTNAGTAGIVPTPTATDNDKYLKGDGTWATVSGGSATDVQINGTSITSQGVANILTNTAYDASSNKIATTSDVPTETTVSGWGFTKNAGTVTSVNNVSPVNGNVSLTIPTQTDVQINGTSITSGGTANIITNSAYNASSNKIATMSDLPTVVTYTGGTGISIGTGNAINHTNSVTAGTAGTSSATSGSTLAVPYVTYDAQGHVTASGTHTHTVTGFLTSITSSDVTNALGYTPSNISASNFNNTGKSFIAGQSMPSGIYDSLTLGASGTTYTAPANGWFYIKKTAGGAGKYLNVDYMVDSTTTNAFYVSATGHGSSTDLTHLLAINKGGFIKIIYNATGSSTFRFYYAVGSEWEK